MGKAIVGIGFLLCVATVSRGGIVITLETDLKQPPKPGDIIHVDILLSSDSDPIELMRGFQFDLADNAPGGQFSGQLFSDPANPDAWQWSAPMNGPKWFKEDPLPIPRANYTRQDPDRKRQIDLTSEPVKVASIEVEFKAPGFLDVTNRDERDPNEDVGAGFRAGFGEDVRKFSIYGLEGFEPVTGGRLFIPEPATMTLLLLAGAALLRRRRVT